MTITCQTLVNKQMPILSLKPDSDILKNKVAQEDHINEWVL